MSDQIPLPPPDSWPHWKHFEEETWWHTAAKLSSRTNVVITPQNGSIGLQGQSVIFTVSTITPRAAQTVKAAPWQLSNWVARVVMSKTSYRTRWEPLIVALHDEYHEYLDSGDVWGARRAVLRHYVVSIPKWAWAFCYEALKYWARLRGFWPFD